MMRHAISLTPDDNDTFLVTSATFPEVTTFGADRADACRQAANAIEEAIAGRMADGEEIPWDMDPDRTVDVRDAMADSAMVRLSMTTAMKVMLWNALKRAGVTRAELCRRLGWHREQVDRLFRLDHATRLDQFDAAFKALGLEVDLVVTQAA